MVANGKTFELNLVTFALVYFFIQIDLYTYFVFICVSVDFRILGGT